MNRYIDTHVHLYDEAFDPDLPQVLERMKGAGVIKCILPAIDRSYYERQRDCAAKYPGYVFEAAGLHPTSVGKGWESELDWVRERLEERNGTKKTGGQDPGAEGEYVAVGEIGLDGYWSKEFLPQQMEVFREQLLLASRWDLPVIIHAREATEEIFKVLESLKGIPLRGVFHAFSGSWETFRRIGRYGDFKVGIGGIVTYKNAGIAGVLEKIPLESVLLETDAPYLPPVPFRGKRNESSYLEIIAGKIAEIKNCPVEEVARTTTENAEKLFKLNHE